MCNLLQWMKFLCCAMGNVFYVLGGTEYGVAATTYLRFDVDVRRRRP